MSHAGIKVRPHDLACIVDIVGVSERGAREVKRREAAPAEQEAVSSPGGILVCPHDLARAVATPRLRTEHSTREVKRRKAAPAE